MSELDDRVGLEEERDDSIDANVIERALTRKKNQLVIRTIEGMRNNNTKSNKRFVGELMNREEKKDENAESREEEEICGMKLWSNNGSKIADMDF